MPVARASGVSEGFGEAFFLRLDDGAFPDVAFFFFFPFGDGSLVGDFFALGFGVASGVSLGLGDLSDSSAGVFFGFAFFFADGEADAAFFFLPGDVFSFGVGVGVFSLATESTARAFRIGFPSSVVCCASETKTAMSALNAKKVVNQTRKRNTERSVTECLARSTRDENQKPVHAGSALPGAGSFFTWPSRSRRRIAFNFPPSSKNKQVRYIHVSKMIIDARARYVAS